MSCSADQRHTQGPIEQWEKSYCPYCGVGCGLLIGKRNGAVVKVKGDPDHPSSLGDLCLKPIHLPEALDTPDRVRHPHLRLHRDEPLRPVSWDDAIDHVAGRLRGIIERHGPDAVGIYGSGQLPSEDYYVANKLLKGFIGTNNFDANSRLCMSSAVAGYTMALGTDGPPPAYTDIDCADSFFIIGSNMAYCHPVLFNRIKRRKKQDPAGVKVIVADPRHTETARLADLFLPLRPGSDVALLNGLLHVLLQEGLVDLDFIAAHTTGFDDVQAAVEPYTPAVTGYLTGLPPALIEQTARTMGTAGALLTLWSMGINQSTSGTAKNCALLNLHLAMGQIGKPGSGPFSLTGQPNAMGGREVGGLAHLLPGYRKVTDADHRAEVEAYWGVAPGAISPRPGLSALELFGAAAEGQIKALWIMGTNPAVSLPHTDLVVAALRKLELLVVSEAYHPTDTSQYAHVLLPAAQWSERDGVMTNSERRITYVPQLTEPVGEARPDWQIICMVARALGFGPAFDFASAAEVFAEFKGLTRGRPCDYSGVTHERLQREGPIQWPAPTPDHPGTPRLYTGLHGDGPRFATADGRARFVPVEHREIEEQPNADYPLVLMTGRLRNQWHTMTRTGKSESLLKGGRQPFVELHPRDAERRNIETGDMVEIRSRRGVVWAEARVSEQIRRGTCFMPFHWGRLVSEQACANNVTTTAVDPVSHEPELKACAVQVQLRPPYKVLNKVLSASPIFQKVATWATLQTQERLITEHER